MKSILFGILLLVESAALFLAALVAGHYNMVAGETDLHCFLYPAVVTGVVGIVLYCAGRRNKNKHLRLRDTYLIVSLAWVLFSFIGMIPFLMYGTMDNVTDAFFETMSGFTTTGATVMNNIDEQPHGILFWRSLIQWLGGLGIIVFTLAFIPSVAKNSKKRALFAAESTGVSVEKLSPKMQNTARNLWIIYIIITLLCAFCYWLGPMNTFDAICHAFTTVATGGFSTHQASFGYYQSTYLEYVCALFMLLSGVNFGLYYFAFTRRFHVVRKNEELHWYLMIGLIFVVLFTLMFQFSGRFNGTTETQLANMPQTLEGRFRTSLFHVANLLSTTGYQARYYDYDEWGVLFVVVTLLLMGVGGCAGSSCGGIKMIRLLILFKYLRLSVREFIHPTGIFAIKVSKQSVDESAVNHVCGFMSLFLLVMLASMLALTASGMAMDDAMASFLTCVSSYGPGSGSTGPSFTFAEVPTMAKWTLAFDMLVGRLEIFTILLLFAPAFWRAK